MKVVKKMIAILLTIVLLFIGYVIINVHFWTITDAGRLPPKTAVILHAIHNNIITSRMKPPNFLVQPKPATIAREDILIDVSDGGQINARVYYPKKEGPHPIIMFYHGGAFMAGYGDLDTHDNIIRAIAARTNSVVIGVGYRVAPDYIFPTAVEDSYDALLWAVENGANFNGDPKRIAVAGDSAGGNLATAVTLMARDLQGPKLTAQALLYPLTTFQDIPLQSRMIYDSGYYLLSRYVMYRARELYTPMEDMWLSPYTSPLNADDLSHLPPTLIITAEFDPLRDEGEWYGERLAEAGVDVTHLHYNGVMHGFVSFYEVMNLGDDGLRKTTTFLNEAFSDQLFEGGLKKEVVTYQKGTSRIRDHIEAYAIAMYLLYLNATM